MGGLGEGVGGREGSYYVQERWQAPRCLSQSKISNEMNSPEECEYEIPKLRDNQTGYEERNEEQEHQKSKGEPCVDGCDMGCRSGQPEGMRYLGWERGNGRG